MSYAYNKAKKKRRASKLQSIRTATGGKPYRNLLDVLKSTRRLFK